VRGGTMRGVALRGVLPAEEGQVSDIPKQFVAGSINNLQAGFTIHKLFSPYKEN
jgi:lipoprotein-releasing system permease protein